VIGSLPCIEQPPDSAPARSANRLPPILVLALNLIVLLLVLDISIRTIPPALEEKTQAPVPESADAAKKPFLGSWIGHSGETLIFSSEGSLITVWPACKIQPQESVTRLIWTEARGILHYSGAGYRWQVSENGKTLTLTPLKEDGSEVSALTFTLQRQ